MNIVSNRLGGMFTESAGSVIACLFGDSLGIGVPCG